MDFNLINFVNSVVYSFLGILIFVVGFWVLDKMTPYNLWKEIVEKQNTALAILVGATALGICLIIAAALVG